MHPSPHMQGNVDAIQNNFIEVYRNIITTLDFFVGQLQYIEPNSHNRLELYRQFLSKVLEKKINDWKQVNSASLQTACGELTEYYGNYINSITYDKVGHAQIEVKEKFNKDYGDPYKRFLYFEALINMAIYDFALVNPNYQKLISNDPLFQHMFKQALKPDVHKSCVD